MNYYDHTPDWRAYYNTLKGGSSMELMEAVKTEMAKREEQVINADPTWQRLRGMLDVLEGKVKLTEQEESSETPPAEPENIEEGLD
jgi:aspartate/methionine/tyrosine aminotransferase